MAGKSANITSIDLVQRTKASLQAFADAMQDALTTLELESRRALEWIENDRGRYWPAEERKAADRLIEAKLSLEQCEITASEDTRKSCYEEKKQVETAKRRHRLCEQKIQAARRWAMELRKDVEEFQVQLAKSRGYMDSDFPKAIANLERLSQSLEKYIQVSEVVQHPDSP